MEFKLTLKGLCEHNPDIENAFTFPPAIDKQLAVDTIYMRNYERPMLYTNPEELPLLIGIWCRKNTSNFEHIAKALLTDYNPLENYDGTEEHTWTESGVNSSTGRSEGTNENKVMAYDSSSYSPESKNDSGGETESSGEYSTTHTETIKKHGNIGVTTTSQMQEGVLKVERNNNLYDIIADMFASEFCYYYFY